LFISPKMHKGQVTIKDIAKELGISPSTVSRALKDHPDISADTKKAVQELALKWNYKPDPIALSLKSRKNKIIGVIIPEMVHYFFSTVISGIEDLAYDSGYHVMICQSNENYEREVKNTQALLSCRVDGILVSVSKRTFDFKHLKTIQESGVPMVFFDRICDEIVTDRVIVDDFEGAYQATKHLISIGCKRIAHLASHPHLIIAQNRQEGYIKALSDHNVPVDKQIIVKCDIITEANEIIPKLLNLPNPPDGFFAVNDLTAAETMKIVKSKGLNVPEDIAIVGFTNGQISNLTNPALSSVEQHGYEIGKNAARLLLDRIEKEEEYPVQTKIIKTELVIIRIIYAKKIIM